MIVKAAIREVGRAVTLRPRACYTELRRKDVVMVLSSADILVDSLRETGLLRADQFRQLVDELAPRHDDTQDLARHIVKLGWITPYQAKKLINGHGHDLILGHYVILDKLGEGGMGKVYKARQLRLSRTVALKVIRPNLLSNDLALKRFQREAKAAAQLAHPNIVRLFDADAVGDRHFLAMEFVEGTDLAALVKDTGPLPVGMACSFIRQAATGLQHAHDQEIVHRDIKPSNLLVSEPRQPGKIDSGGVIKILDMGLARATTQDDDSSLSALTQDGTVIGTPDYMSPEQGKNSSEVDGRSDLYSLGCTLYFLLTGRTPFSTGTMLEKLLQHQIDPPPPIKELRPDLPDEVAALVHTLLAKKPEDRFQSGAALAHALDIWSVFDTRSELLKKSTLKKPAAVPYALPVPHEPLPSSGAPPVAPAALFAPVHAHLRYGEPVQFRIERSTAAAASAGAGLRARRQEEAGAAGAAETAQTLAARRHPGRVNLGRRRNHGRPGSV